MQRNRKKSTAKKVTLLTIDNPAVGMTNKAAIRLTLDGGKEKTIYIELKGNLSWRDVVEKLLDEGIYIK